MGKVIPLDERLRNLKEYEGQDQVKSAVEVYDDLREASKGLLIYKSRIPGLDRWTQGFAPGELITISGPTKNGKTLLAQTLTRNFYLQGLVSLWFTFEVPPMQFVDQFGSDLPLIYMPGILKPCDLNWLEDRVIESIEKFNSKIVFIDHLHFLFDLMSAKNVSLQIGQVIRRLKQIAINFNQVIFLMAHTAKANPDGEMSYFQIRDSSFISQESDSVLMIRRSLKNKIESFVSVEFHRRTGVLREIVKLRKQGNLLVEPIEEQKYSDQF
jgi:replicative DNA helicase